MALDREQIGLLFKISADSTDAVQSLQVMENAVTALARQSNTDLAQVTNRFQALGTQVQQTGREFATQFGDAARGSLTGFVSQFGLVGEAAAGMIPSLTGSSAALAGIAGAAVAATAALSSATLSTAEYAGALNDLADVSNLEIDTLQGLNAGAALVGESFESLTTSTIIFQKQIEAAKNGNEELAGKFRALSVDLNGTVDEAFRQTLEHLNNLDDGSTKTAIATELFGKQAGSLLKIMKEMNGNYDSLIARAAEFGVKLSKDDIDAADKFGKQLDILEIKAKGFAYAIGTEVIRAIEIMRLRLVYLGVLESDSARQQAEAIARLEAVDTRPGGGPSSAEILARLEEERKKRLEEERKNREAANKATTTRAKTQQLVNLPSGEGIKRAYDAYMATILREEQRVAAERERYRVELLANEEARLIDAQTGIEERLAQARIEAQQTAGDVLRGPLAAQRVAALEAELELSKRALEQYRTELEAAQQAFYDADLKAFQDAEEKKRQEYERSQQQFLRLQQAIRNMLEAGERQRIERLQNDPSSPLSIFGMDAQAAADQGADLFGQLTVSATSALQTVSGQVGSFKTLMVDAFSGIAQGLESMLQAFILTGKFSGQAFKAMAAQVISALAAQAAVKAIFNLAEGFANLALGNFGSASQNFAAAALYGSIAGVAAVAGAGIAAIGPSAAGGQAGFVTQDRQQRGTIVREQGTREPQVVIIRAETEPGVIVRQIVGDYRANGETRAMLRRDLLGEA